MTREQAKAKLISFGIAEPTEDQITNLLNSINDEKKTAEDKANQYKADAEKAVVLQKQIDDINEKGLTDVEKSNKALADAQKQIADLTANSFKSEAKAILGKAGFTDEDLESLLPGLIADTLENTQARANAFVTAITKQTDNAVKAHEQKLLDGTKKPDGNPGGDDKKTDAQKFAESTFKANTSDKNGTESVINNYK